MRFATIIIILLLTLFHFYGITQPLVLDKVNDIETTGLYVNIKQIEPLPNNDIAVSLISSNYLFGGELENLSIANKDTVIRVFEFYQRPYEISFIQFDKNSKFLYAVKRNISDDIREVWLHSLHIGRKTHDSLNVSVKYPYREIILSDNYLSFFGSGKSAEREDSLLLEQVFDISLLKISEIWQADTIKKGVDRGNRFNDVSYYTLSIPTYGAYVPNREPAYVVNRTSSNFKEIEFYSSNEEHNVFYPFGYSDFNPIFSINDSTFYIVYRAHKQYNWDWSHRNYVLVSFNMNQNTVNWQYHGVENYTPNYVKPTVKGTHLIL